MTIDLINLINLLIQYKLWTPMLIFIVLALVLSMTYYIMYKPLLKKFTENESEHEYFKRHMNRNEEDHMSIMKKFEEKNDKMMGSIDKLTNDLNTASKRRDEQFSNIKFSMEKIAKDIFEYSLEKQSEIAKRKQAQYDILKIFSLNALDEIKRNINKYLLTLENKEIDSEEIDKTFCKIVSTARQDITHQIERQGLPVSFHDASEKVYETIAPMVETGLEDMVDMLKETALTKDRVKDITSKVIIIIERVKVIYVDVMRKLILNECD